jgi:argininosuccinate synthase
MEYCTKDMRVIRSLDDLNYVQEKSKRILTLFSGGLDSVFVLHKLLKSSNTCEVIALTVDLGDDIDENNIQMITKKFGVRSIIVDAKLKFARDAILYAIKANAKYHGIYPISASLSRPIIAQEAVNLANELNCDAIIHTANQSQNSLRRLNGAIKQLDYTGYFGTPYEFSAITRDEKIVELNNIGLTHFKTRGVSGDANLWCREFESGTIEDPEHFEVPSELFKWTQISKLRGESELCLIKFKSGIPISVNNKNLDLIKIIELLNNLVGSYGIGRFSGLEHLENGEKVLEVREAPAAKILMEAYRHLETAILGYETIKEKITLEQILVKEAIEGRWFSTLKNAICSFIDVTSEKISGSVEFKLEYGSMKLCSIIADTPKYLRDRDSWEKRVAIIRSTSSLAQIDKQKSQLDIFKTHNFKDNLYFFDNLNSCFDDEFSNDDNWKQFSLSWNDLDRDEYMADGGMYRYRRYSEFLINSQDLTIHNMPNVPYTQSKNINHLNGGIERYYSAISNQIKSNQAFENVLKYFTKKISRIEGKHKKYLIQIFQNRILTSTSGVGLPTPEGIHRDGVDYVLTLLINRVGIVGGVSSLYKASDKSILTSIQLENPGDFIFADDNQLLHDVTPLHTNSESAEGYRDVLIAMFKNYEV